MVDSIGSSTIKAAGDPRIAPVARVAAPAPQVAIPPAQEQVRDGIAPTTLARTMATAAPIDTDRVKAIKTAIANGTFPLSPATIADQLIALKYEWMSND